GYPDAVLEKLRGIFVPKGTPKVIKDKLAAALKESMDDPDFKAFYTQNSLVPAWAEGEDFVKILAKQTEQVKESLATLKK
ncbi:MAG: hypothetical protein IJ233_13620, partial [Pyramidobacter sp.]|nr:hypothetical protein [Pyramidobacter sp.]